MSDFTLTEEMPSTMSKYFFDLLNEVASEMGEDLVIANYQEFDENGEFYADFDVLINGMRSNVCVSKQWCEDSQLPVVPYIARMIKRGHVS